MNEDKYNEEYIKYKLRRNNQFRDIDMLYFRKILTNSLYCMRSAVRTGKSSIDLNHVNFFKENNIKSLIDLENFLNKKKNKNNFDKLLDGLKNE